MNKKTAALFPQICQLIGHLALVDLQHDNVLSRDKIILQLEARLIDELQLPDELFELIVAALFCLKHLDNVDC